MTARVAATTIDCHDAYALSEWWKEVLDYVDLDGDPNLPGHEECLIVSRDGTHRLLFIEVPDDKVVKNRWHFDLAPDDQVAEVTRLKGLGARDADIGQGDVPWVVMADVEGNEFCVLRSLPKEEAAG